ncbi:MAG: DEAD/DEAH box helicase [bacterium]
MSHPFLRDGAIEFRGYQANLARIAAVQDTLVVLPTGMGKTVVATLVLADALRAGAKRVLVLAPTRPLVEQHAASLKAVLAAPWPDAVHALTGTASPKKREAAYGAETAIVTATPQVVHNDILGGRLDIAAFDWVVFDEAHRAVGDYPYVFIGQEMQARAPKSRRLGLTASPGHEVRKIEEVRAALGLGHVEIRTPADPDVAPYVQTIAMEWETLPLPPTMARVSAKLHEALAERIKALKAAGFLKTSGNRPNRRELLMLGGELQARLAKTPNPESNLYAGLSLQAQAMKIQHAIEQVETQGAAAFVEYAENLRAEAKSAKATKASRSVADDARVNEAYQVARHDDAENPKLGRTGVLVQEQVERDAGARIIVFTHYRATCELVAAHLAKLPGVRPVVFVGQQRRGTQEGLSQKEQRAALDRFRAGEHNVLVATSVAEEGLDIPDTDLVIFFEPIPSEIRSIQRRGRTGRSRAGRVIVLMTKGTQDEAAHWSARRKEQQMVKELQGLRQVVERTEAQGPAMQPPIQRTGAQATLDAMPRATTRAAGPAPQASLGAAPRIIFDSREQAGGVVRHLHDLGCELEGRSLDIGDYVLSDRVVVERKATADFVDSLVDGRLFEQMKAMKTYPRPILVIEGESLYGHRNVAAEAILGALASVSIDYGIPVLTTRDPLETARFLHAVAKREQQREQRKLAVRPGRPTTDREQQIFLLGGLPGVSAVLAERLLDTFGSVERVMAATASELARVDGIGEGKAAEMRRILELEWLAQAVSR